MTNSLFILLMASQGSSSGSATVNMLFMLGMIAVMYFLMIRPQMKKQKEQKAFSSSNNVGDIIVTIAGMHGKIVSLGDDGTIKVEIDRNTIVKMETSSISMEMTSALRKKLEAPKVA
jgi:preprotein translocase subunit YajC